MKEPTIEELLDDLKHKDRRFRRAAGVFMGLILAGVIALAGLSVYEVRRLNDQSLEREAGLRALSEENKRLNEQTNQYLQCIARFFATTDRQDRALTDLDRCIYVDENGQLIPGLDSQPTAVPSEQSPAPSNQNDQQPNTNSNAGPVPGGPAVEEPQPEEPPSEPRPPVEVLGIPVCVPLIDVCLRQ